MGPWQFAVVTLAAYRVWRIIARDSITEKAREVVTGVDDDHAPELADADRSPHPGRVYLSALIRCPWCSGFYVSIAAYAAWLIFPTETFWVSLPLAISAALGIIRKTLDQ